MWPVEWPVYGQVGGGLAEPICRTSSIFVVTSKVKNDHLIIPLKANMKCLSLALGDGAGPGQTGLVKSPSLGAS
jgi:hypothetical protein